MADFVTVVTICQLCRASFVQLVVSKPARTCIVTFVVPKFVTKIICLYPGLPGFEAKNNKFGFFFWTRKILVIFTVYKSLNSKVQNLASFKT